MYVTWVATAIKTLEKKYNKKRLLRNNRPDTRTARSPTLLVTGLLVVRGASTWSVGPWRRSRSTARGKRDVCPLYNNILRNTNAGAISEVRTTFMHRLVNRLPFNKEWRTGNKTNSKIRLVRSVNTSMIIGCDVRGGGEANAVTEESRFRVVGEHTGKQHWIL